MKRVSQSRFMNPKTFCLVCRAMTVGLFLLLAAMLPVQGQQGGSLADAARQARAQKQGQAKPGSTQAQQVADQMSEEQNDTGAPGGFKTYNAGDYNVWIPAPYMVEGHDDAGIVLAGPTIGSKRPLILVGTPIVTHWENSDAAFQDAATQFSRLYAQTTQCTKTTVADHAAFKCGMAAATLLGRQMGGNAVFVRGSGTIYPVLCLAPTDSGARDTLNNPRASYQDKLAARDTLAREEQDVRSVWQKCDTVFSSIHVKPGMGKQAEAKSGNNSDTTANASGTDSASSGAPGSLADVARRLKQDPSQAAVVAAPAPAASPQAQTTVPAGFKIHAFQYCSGPRQCWNGSVLVPVDAKLVSSDCNKYVFEVKVQGTPFLLMAGSAGAECGTGGPDPVSWNQLADPESKRAPGTYSTISSQVAKIDDKAATITTLSFRKGLTDWMGERAEVENNGVPLVVGCIAPRDRFADGDAVCSALIGSLRLP
ncbi:MAG TPA: hypothetical protein VFE61_22920 [Candidatus Sulfotelmatobacter sp.]|nr:hypothetical protein [Candidatus Sulfotelmatobacter sp.]